MTQQVNPLERAANFLHHQGAKGFDELETLMKQTSEDWARCLDGMTETQATHQPEPGEHIPTPASGEGPKWCVKETIGHYLLSERSLNNTAAGLAGVDAPPDPPLPVRAMGEQSPDYEALPLDGLRQKLAGFFEETGTLIGGLRSHGTDGRPWIWWWRHSGEPRDRVVQAPFGDQEMPDHLFRAPLGTLAAHRRRDVLPGLGLVCGLPLAHPREAACPVV